MTERIIDSPNSYDLGEVADPTFGVPEEYRQGVVRDLLKVLDEQGIDPSTVLFSGYSEGWAHANEEQEEQNRNRIAVLGAEIVRLQSEGRFEDDPDLKKEYQDRLKALKAGPEKAYFFGDVDSLSHEQGAMDNPIDYAATGEGAIIGVYDKAAINALSPDDTHLAGVEATAEQIDAARLFAYRPRYILEED